MYSSSLNIHVVCRYLGSGFISANIVLAKYSTMIRNCIITQCEMAVSALQLWRVLYPGDEMPRWNPQCTKNEVG